MQYKLGKLPARPGAVKLKFSTFADTVKLADPPQTFGHEKLIPQWGMFLNDRIGDCAIAGAIHETMLWNAEASAPVQWNQTLTAHNSAAVNYAAVTGYEPGPEIENPNAPANPTDQGTDVASLCEYRKKTGLIDGGGKRHKIGAFVALDPGDFNQLWYATYYFDGVGIGVKFPEQWETAFANGEPWDALKSPNYVGGHYITAVCWDQVPQPVTWGTLMTAGITQAGYEQNCDEAVAYLTEEKLLNGKDLEGLDLAGLRSDLRALDEL